MAPAAILMLTACTKIETTNIGSDLIPVVDNVKTFETVLDVTGNNYLDTLVYKLNRSNPHVVGAISNEPVFGSSSASLFFQMTPASFPYTALKRDSIQGSPKVGFDSAVLILDFVGFYGDSVQETTFKLYDADKTLQRDSSVNPYYTLNPDLNANTSVLWGSKTISANKLKDSVSVIRKGDTSRVTNQLRIPLDRELALKLFVSDSANYVTDTTFRALAPGFALVTEGPVNTLYYFSLAGNSKVEFFYHANPLSALQDTTSRTFTVTTYGGHAVKYKNDHTGSELSSHLIPDPVKGDNKLYIETSPGSYAALKINGIDTVLQTNRIIHRAELRIVRDDDASSQFTAPTALYLDAIDTIKKTYQGIPYDLSPYGRYYCYPSAGPDYNYFGGFPKLENIDGTSLYVYRFNIARYLQGVVSRKEQLFPLLRLSAPFYMYYQDCSNGGVAYPTQVFPFVEGSSLLNPVGRGRIKLTGNGTGVDPKKRMQLRIIYSTI
jgi:hypothetical protein